MSKYKQTNQRQNTVVETTPSPTKARYSENGTEQKQVINADLLFGKKNYIYMAIGVGLIFLGLMLMAGGKMPSPDVWDENIIYSSRRTLIAPIVILAGLGIQFWAIFSKKS